jgi:hypothetical protein
VEQPLRKYIQNTKLKEYGCLSDTSALKVIHVVERENFPNLHQCQWVKLRDLSLLL